MLLKKRVEGFQHLIRESRANLAESLITFIVFIVAGKKICSIQTCAFPRAVECPYRNKIETVAQSVIYVILLQFKPLKGSLSRFVGAILVQRFYHQPLTSRYDTLGKKALNLVNFTCIETCGELDLPLNFLKIILDVLSSFC